MVFELTARLSDEILNALENQNQTFFVDAARGVLVSDSDSVCCDDDSFYSLPEWTSAQGFALREDFVSSLRAPFAKEELLDVLHSGRGVFKNFKNTLKKYPEIEKTWHQYKNRTMSRYVSRWYNQLREVWGLEELPDEPEDCDNLLDDDFQFHAYSSSDEEELTDFFKAAALEYSGAGDHQDIQNVIFDLWLELFQRGKNHFQSGILCRSVSDEIVGCITAAQLSDRTDNVVILTSFYVQEKFRGLGIGTQLISSYLDALKDQKKEWLLLTSIVPEAMEPALRSLGFQRNGSYYSARV